MIRYLVTTHEHLEGARLSRPGHWGNLPFNDEAEAEEFARQDAAGAPIRLERKALPALPTPRWLA